MTLRTAIRPLLATTLSPGTRPFWALLERGRDGSGLAPGITAVVAARNEAYTIGFSLRSLIGFADQIVCIDNGSTDDTLAEMRRFQEEHNADVDIDVVSMAGALLGECREAGLERTRRQWHLRWDADHVAVTTGPDSILELRDKILADRRPRTVQLSRTNLHGDLCHTSRTSAVVDPGEPFLMRFGRGIRYREYGKFDAVRVPFHYLQTQAPGRHVFHLAGLKSDENLIHRFHYFAWREAVNREGGAGEPDLYMFDSFKKRRNLLLFGTNEPRSLKFRYQRQLSYHLTRFDTDRFGDYPKVLKDELSTRQRFEVVYRDGRPWLRVDHEDPEMLDYRPTPEDLAWDPEAFLRRFLTEEECRLVGIDPPVASQPKLQTDSPSG